MEIKIAQSAGFCFGVDLAIRNIEKLLKDTENNPVYTYGPIIHNPTVVSDYKKRGVHVIESLNELDTLEKGMVLIRSHGVTEHELEVIQAKGFYINDSTCPYVKKIHKLVKKASDSGNNVIIVGNKEHPEVKGIAGWVNTQIIFVNSMEELLLAEFDETKTYEIVAQTTFNHLLYEEILNKLQNMNIRVIINETICQATWKRQVEAKELSKNVDKMIVIGGKNSSNTRKLYEICKDQCKETYYIETIEDLVLNVFAVNDIIGITAGASTPKKIIEEVISNVRNAKF